jgi:hypothetical protein
LPEVTTPLRLHRRAGFSLFVTNPLLLATHECFAGAANALVFAAPTL